MDWTQPTLLNAGDVLTSTIWNAVADDIPFFDWKVTSKAVNTTTSETDLFNGEIILPAGVMGSNERLEGWASIDLKNNTGSATNSPRLKLKADTTVLYDTGTTGGTPIAASATRGSGQIHFTLQQLNATNLFELTVFGWIVDGAKVNASTGSGIFATNGSSDGQKFHGRNQVTLDMTAARTLALTVINPSANANWETCLYAAKVAVGV